MTDTNRKALTEENNMTTTENTQPETVAPTEAMIAKVQTVNVGLPATHRCDGCNAQAYVEVEMPNALRLEFCAHHYTRSEEALAFQAVRIIDHRPFLAEQERRFKGGVPA